MDTRERRRLLTELELRVLTMAANGATDAMMVRETGLTLGQVRYAMRSAVMKLRAASRTHSVALAVSAGFIAVGQVNEQ